jgi:hypothetical protein
LAEHLVEDHDSIVATSSPSYCGIVKWNSLADKKSGVARRFVGDIARWARDYKTTHRSDDIEVRSL